MIGQAILHLFVASLHSPLERLLEHPAVSTGYHIIRHGILRLDRLVKTVMLFVRKRFGKRMDMVEHNAKSENDDIVSHRFDAKDGEIHQSVTQTVEKNPSVYAFFITVHGNSRSESFCFHLRHISSPHENQRFSGTRFSQR